MLLKRSRDLQLVVALASASANYVPELITIFHSREEYSQNILTCYSDGTFIRILCT